MLDWHLGMAEGGDGPRELLSPADAITLARFWLVGRRAARDRAADRRLCRAAALNGGAPLARMTAILAQ